MTDPVVQFIQMSVVDRQIQATQARIEQLHNTTIRLTQDTESKQKTIQELNQKLFNSKKDLLSLEHQLVGLQEREKNKTLALEAAASPKEYQSLHNELAILSQQKMGIEDQIVQLMIDIESFEKDHSTTRTLLESEVNALQKSLLDTQQQLASEKDQLKTIELHRLELLQQFPQEWLSEYERARASYSNPCVPVENGACTGCFHALTESEMATLRRKRLMRCADCFRFLVQEKEWTSS